MTITDISTKHSLSILMDVEREPGNPMTYYLGDSRSSRSRFLTLRRLEGIGLIEYDRGDHNRHHVFLTHKGQMVVGHLKAIEGILEGEE